VTGSKDSLNDRIAQNDHAVIKTLRDTLIAGGVRPEITDKIKIDEGKHISGVDSRDLRDKLEQYKKDGLTTAELDSFAKDVVTKIEGVKPPVAVDPTATVTPTPAAAPPTAASEPTK